MIAPRLTASCLLACLCLAVAATAEEIRGIDMDILRAQAAAELNLPYPYVVDAEELARETAAYRAAKAAQAERIAADFEPLDSPEVFATKRNYRYPIPAVTATDDAHREAALLTATATADRQYSPVRLQKLLDRVDTDYSSFKYGDRIRFETPAAPYHIDGIFYGIKGDFYLFGDLQVLKQDVPTEVRERFDHDRMAAYRERRRNEIKTDYMAQRQALLTQQVGPLLARSLKADNYVETEPDTWVPLAEIFLAYYAEYTADHAERKAAFVTKGQAQFMKAKAAELALRGLKIDPATDQVVGRETDYMTRVAALYEQAALYHINAAPPRDQLALAKVYLDALPHPKLAPGTLRAKLALLRNQ